MKKLALVLVLGLVCSVCSAGEAVAQKWIVRFASEAGAPTKGTHVQVVKGLQDQLERSLSHMTKVPGTKILNKLWIVNGIEMLATPEQVQLLKESKNVISVQPVTYRRYVDKDINRKAFADPAPKVVWSVAKVRAPEAWDKLKIDGSGVVVGHLDTGIDAQHSALKGKVLLFKDFTPVPKIEAYDDQGHGTHTAGSIAGGEGVGVAPGARLIVGKIFDKNGGAEDAGLLLSMQWVMDPDGNPETNDGPALVSNSWGSDTTTDRSFWDAVKAWENAGILPVFAAGNNGPSGKVGTPGNYPHSWAVAATGNKDTLAYFSSVGPSEWDGVMLVKPDIAGPGAGVVSCAVGGGLVSNSGTSMACPHVAGLAALMLQAKPGISIADMRKIAEETAIDLGTPGKDNKFGSGRFDAFACIKKILDNVSLLEAFQAYEAALQTENALIGVQANSPLAAPLAKSLIIRAQLLDEGEFRSLNEEVRSHCGKAACQVLEQAGTARTGNALNH